MTYTDTTIQTSLLENTISDEEMNKIRYSGNVCRREWWWDEYEEESNMQLEKKQRRVKTCVEEANEGMNMKKNITCRSKRNKLGLRCV